MSTSNIPVNNLFNVVTGNRVTGLVVDPSRAHIQDVYDAIIVRAVNASSTKIRIIVATDSSESATELRAHTYSLEGVTANTSTITVCDKFYLNYWKSEREVSLVVIYSSRPSDIPPYEILSICRASRAYNTRVVFITNEVDFVINPAFFTEFGYDKVATVRYVGENNAPDKGRIHFRELPYGDLSKFEVYIDATYGYEPDKLSVYGEGTDKGLTKFIKDMKKNRLKDYRFLGKVSGSKAYHVYNFTAQRYLKLFEQTGLPDDLGNYMYYSDEITDILADYKTEQILATTKDIAAVPETTPLLYLLSTAKEAALLGVEQLGDISFTDSKELITAFNARKVKHIGFIKECRCDMIVNAPIIMISYISDSLGKRLKALYTEDNNYPDIYVFYFAGTYEKNIVATVIKDLDPKCYTLKA